MSIGKCNECGLIGGHDSNCPVRTHTQRHELMHELKQLRTQLAALQAENERLKKETEELADESNKLANDLRRAEQERDTLLAERKEREAQESYITAKYKAMLEAAKEQM